jgi:hypothetical protein
MQHESKSHIVADGQSRIVDGFAARLRGRLVHRAAPLLERANPLQRMAIRYRMFVLFAPRFAGNVES